MYEKARAYSKECVGPYFDVTPKQTNSNCAEDNRTTSACEENYEQNEPPVFPSGKAHFKILNHL